MEHLLVTGGAGFIGSAVVRQAMRDGHEVVNLDALTYAANLENVADVAGMPGYAFEQVDIRARSARSAAMRLMSTSISGDDSRMLSVGIRLWPPASTCAPSLSASSSSASSMLSGRR